jgi:DNA-binding transcriptional ArsR family regulator
MSPDRLSATFAALADPTRRAILARLASGETTVSELARPFEMSLPAVTKHLKVLQRAGLISQGRQAQWRPCKLEAEPLQDVSNWVEQYRQFWEQRLDRLEEYLRELQASEKLANEKQANDRAADAADEQIGKAPVAVSKAKGKKEGKKK